MVHTMTITHRIESVRVYNEIFDALNLISKQKGVNLYSQGKEYITHALKDKGIRKIAVMKREINSKYKYPFMQISITLNPAILIGKGYGEIICKNDIEYVEDEFNKLIESIHKDLPRLLNWIVNRIDYAINIRTNNVKEYIKLFQRSDKPINYKELYCKKSKRRKQLEGSFYLVSNSININFYDKEHQMLKQGFTMHKINNLLRLEVQCKKNKVNSIKQSKGFDACLVRYFLDSVLSEEIILYYYRKLIGEGYYYTLEDAIQIVEDSNYTNRTKNKCISILKEVNSSRSIWKAREKSSHTKEEFNRYLKYIREVKVNVVTIPSEWNISNLKSLI